MKLSLQTWNSVNINDGSPFVAVIPPGQLANLSRSPVLVNRANDYPSLSTFVKQPSIFIINVIIASGQNINTNRELLKSIFFGDDERHNIVAIDKNDSDRQYFRRGYPVRLVQENDNTPNSFFVTIQTEYPYWQVVTAVSDSWDITASGDSDTINNIGNLPVKPVITITPTVTKTAGLKYERYIPAYNNLTNTISLPIEITNGGLDVQSLIDAGKMQASGNDFRVWQDGAFAERWLYGMDSDSDPAKCWANLTLDAKTEGTTGATFDSDDTTMVFSESQSNLSFLQTLESARNFSLLIDSEVIAFNPTYIDTLNYQITNLLRGQKNTTAVSHSSPATVRYLSHDLFILYGDSDLAAQDVNAANQPMFDLSSTNLLWTYTNYKDEIYNRPAAWKNEVKSSLTKLSYTFTDYENSFAAQYATELGMAEVNSIDFTVPHESASLSWTLGHPCGITAVTFSGEKYRTGSWPGIAGLQYLQPNTVWFTASNLSTPSVALTWESFTPVSASLPGTYNTIRFCIEGVLSSVINEAAMIQIDSVDISIDSDNLPTLSMGAEAQINFLDFKLTNVRTSEYIKVRTPCPVGTSLVVDCTLKKAYLADGSSVPVILSSNRDDWLNLLSGANGFVYEDTGTAGVNIVFSHRDMTL